jgi:hypothetical protein
MTIIPENLLRCVNPADRKKLGPAGQTAEEAMQAFTIRSEKDLQKQICNLLSLRGIWFSWSRMDCKTTAKVGTPDFLLVSNGIPIALEAKFGNGKLSEEQERTHALMTRDGWKVRVVRSLEEVRTILNCAQTVRES